MDKEITIKKWLNDELSPQEQYAFESSDDGVFYKAILQQANRFKAPQVGTMPSFEIFEEDRLQNVARKKNAQPWLRWIAGAAAAIFLTFGLYTWYTHTTTTIETSIAQTETVILPDNSQVLLTAVSQLSYDRNSWSDERVVHLQGEAFFDVAKGSRFDVQTDVGTISVLGTEFNVRQRRASLEVVCYEGTVQVRANDILEVIEAGEEVSIRNGNLVKGKTLSSRPSWQDNMSRFQNTPLSEVVEELERYYDVDVILEGATASKMFTGAFEHKDLNKALQEISSPFGMQYEIKNNGKEIILNAK